MTPQTVIILKARMDPTRTGGKVLKVLYRGAVDGSAGRWGYCFRTSQFPAIVEAMAKAESIVLDIEVSDRTDDDGNPFLTILGVENKNQTDMFRGGDDAGV